MDARVVLYDDTRGGAAAAVADAVAASGLAPELRHAPWHNAPPAELERVAHALATTKVRRPDRPVPRDWRPFPVEVHGERRALTGDGRPPGPLYDGTLLMRTWLDAFAPGERRYDGPPAVVLTDRLVATFEGARYHVRFLVAGHPSVVSLPGFVDAPARDRSYYLARQLVGLDASLVATDDHLRPGDPRLPACAASAVLQAVAFRASGEAFCEDAGCRLFNPHWQRELLASMAGTRLCARHEAWLDGLRPHAPA